MLQLPPIPTWDSLHPIVVHFPIALLIVCPLFILISAFLPPPKGRPYMIVALITIVLGTISLLVAEYTGEVAARLVGPPQGPRDRVLAEHNALASETAVIFLALSIILLVMIILPTSLHLQETRLSSTFMPLAFLALYSVGILFLANTAHLGGRLVHEFGTHAKIHLSTEQNTRIDSRPKAP